jgi:hypothetical protein
MNLKQALYTLLVMTILLVATMSILVGITAQATAQEEPTPPTQTPDDTPENRSQIYETVDANTRIVSLEYNDDDQTMSVVIESDDHQRVVLTDAGAFTADHDIDRKVLAMEPGQRATVRLRATTVDGRIGLGVDTPETLTGITKDVGSSFISGPWSANDVRLAAICGLLGGLLITGTVAYRRVHGSGYEPEQVL